MIYKIFGIVETFADLPNPEEFKDKIFKVKKFTGIWPFANARGKYISTGQEWHKIYDRAEDAEDEADLARWEKEMEAKMRRKRFNIFGWIKDLL